MHTCALYYINQLQDRITLAFSHRLYGHSTATHESGNTRWFHRGRTDTIRSCTNAAHTFVQTMADSIVTVRKLLYHMHACMSSMNPPPPPQHTH